MQVSFPSCHKATNPHLTRYGLYDYEYEHQCQGTTESSKKQKLFLMAWCPDSAKIKKKMLYSSSFDALKKSLVGVHKFIQVKSLLLIFLFDVFCYLNLIHRGFHNLFQATDLSEASEGEVSFFNKFPNCSTRKYFWLPINTFTPKAFLSPPSSIFLI